MTPARAQILDVPRARALLLLAVVVAPPHHTRLLVGHQSTTSTPTLVYMTLSTGTWLLCVFLEVAKVLPSDEGEPPAMKTLTQWTTERSTTLSPPLYSGCTQRLVTAKTPPQVYPRPLGRLVRAHPVHCRATSPRGGATVMTMN